MSGHEHENGQQPEQKSSVKLVLNAKGEVFIGRLDRLHDVPRYAANHRIVCLHLRSPYRSAMSMG